MTRVTPELCPPHDALKLGGVFFRHAGSAGDKPDAARQIGLRIPRGGMVGLISPSGAGKSAAAGLLDPTPAICLWMASP
ncbi:hypothetical protein [Desulfovibrio sp. SGI.169]|uniref:hypothetical protein n=1 Tax=Desulfovibrio sp. SGI.169 TaxID=3420561 RepID=UPI003D033E34